MKTFILALLFTGSILVVQAQCGGGNAFITTAAPTTTGSTLSISTCTFAGEYNTITGIVAGTSYTVTASGSQCITVHTGSSSGPVVAFGTGTVTFTAPSSGTYYLSINTTCAGCGTASSCVATSITNNGLGGGGGTNPCTSITNIAGCSQLFTQTTTGASSYVSNLCGTPTPGLEMIYSYTATFTGNYNINVATISGGGVVLGYKTLTAGCSATGWNCISAVTTPGTYGTIPLTAGTTYYFLVDATSTASTSFMFSLTCPPGGPTTAGDCYVAANVCSNASFAIDPNGYGTIDEICLAGSCAANPSINPASTNPGCLLSEELNSTWMVVNVLTGGSLTFSIGTPSSGTFNCLDWSMWAYSPTTCSNIINGTQAPIRCNYNGACEQYTGLASTLPAGATSMTNWEPPVTASSYTQYLICLSNYSSATTSVPLSFGGTAVVSCTPLGPNTLSLQAETATNGVALQWKAPYEITTTKYVIEKSKDGVGFDFLAEIPAQQHGTEAVQYAHLDETPSLGYNYYRIASISAENVKTYSSMEAVFFDGSAVEPLTCQPNPANGQTDLRYFAAQNGTHTVRLVDLSGNVLYHTSLDMKAGLNSHALDLRSCSKGIYFVQVAGPGGQATHQVKLVCY